jgi:hypothetical protein
MKFVFFYLLIFNSLFNLGGNQFYDFKSYFSIKFANQSSVSSLNKKVKISEINRKKNLEGNNSLGSVESVTQSLGITSAEYFWGINDPGEGNGQILLSFDGSFDESIEGVLKSSMGNPNFRGSQVFNIRLRDSNNQWGTTFRKQIFIDSVESNTHTIGITIAE